MIPHATDASMLEAIDLAAQRGSTHLFASLNFRVEPECALLVTGANGTGKTTLLRILAGLGMPTAGRVRWRGVDVAPFRRVPAAGRRLLRSSAALKDELTAEENLASLVALTGDRRHPRLRAALAQRRARTTGPLPARALSQGQRRRLGLARLSLTHRPLWLLDEPATALDTAGVALLTRLLPDTCERAVARWWRRTRRSNCPRRRSARSRCHDGRPAPPRDQRRASPDAGAWAGVRWALARDLRLALRSRAELGVQLLFYVIVVSLFPLATTPEKTCWC